MILCLTSNSILADKIGITVHQLGFDYLLFQSMDQLQDHKEKWNISQKSSIVVNQHNQPINDLSRKDTGIIDVLTRIKPVLLIIDLESKGAPNRNWVSVITTDPATRRIPIIFVVSDTYFEGSHTNAQQDTNLCISHIRFISNINEYILKYARVIDLENIKSTCNQPISPIVLRGINLFNQGEYFEAHELLEEAWKEDITPGRELYRAILQIGIAYLQIERGNYKGAIKMFLRVRQWIDPFPDVCRGIDIKRLKNDYQKVYDSLIAIGPDKMDLLDKKLFKPVRFVHEESNGPSISMG